MRNFETYIIVILLFIIMYLVMSESKGIKTTINTNFEYKKELDSIKIEDRHKSLMIQNYSKNKKWDVIGSSIDSKQKLK